MTYTRTDGLYSLEVSARGLDVIYPDGSRCYLASERDAASEELVCQHLGQVLLTWHRRENNMDVYAVPRGAMLLSRILASAPYEKAFMERLQQQSETLLAELRTLDADAFGIRLKHLALIGEQIVIVPPLKATQSVQSAALPAAPWLP